MPKILYKSRRFVATALNAISHVDRILREYQERGFTMTLRQVYYQFVAHDLFTDDRKWRQISDKKWVRDPNGTKNAEPNYKWLGILVGQGRMAGLLDWAALEDRGRNLESLSTWESPEQIVTEDADVFRMDLWQNQHVHLEVWVEKDALIGVIGPTCKRLRVGCFACKGYVSLSEMWDAAYNRFRPLAEDHGKKLVILHLGDHDPSGIDMTRDIQERMELLSGVDIRVDRIALTMDQIEEFGPPPNPAKVKDARFKKYQEMYGDESWELDALPPDVLASLIETGVAGYCDPELFDDAHAVEDDHRRTLRKIGKHWDAVQTMLAKIPDQPKPKKGKK